MRFRWNEYSLAKTEKHGVTAEEVEHVVRYGKIEVSRRHEGAFVATGTSPAGRRIRVGFVLEAPEEQPYEGVMAEYHDEDVVFVFHAMPTDPTPESKR